MGEPGVRVSKKDWVTAQEAAQILSVHPTTVHGWIRKGFVYGEKGESKVRMFGGRTRTMKMWFVDANEVQDYAAKVEESSKTLHRRGAKAYRYKRGGVNGMDMSRMAEEVLKDVPPGVEMTANEVRKSIKEQFGVKVLKQSLWAVMSVLHKHKVIYRSRKGHYMIADRTPQQQPLQP
jgi:transposase